MDEYAVQAPELRVRPIHGRINLCPLLQVLRIPVLMMAWNSIITRQPAARVTVSPERDQHGRKTVGGKVCRRDRQEPARQTG